MVHLRIIAPREEADRAIALLRRAPSCASLVVYRDAALEPEGDVVSCDISDEDAAFVIGDLRLMGISECGVVDVEHLDASISTRGRAADARTAGRPADAILWHSVGERIANQGFISWGLVALFSLAGMIAAIAVLLDSAPIVVGAMAVSPDFGPIAAFAAGVVRLRRDISLAGLAALIAGFTAAIVAAHLMTWFLILTDIAPDQFVREGNTLAEVIAAPDGYSVIVALCAGCAGMLSVALDKSGALVGVAISITTIPAAADIGLSAAYGDWASWRGASLQLALNIAGLLAATTVTLWLLRSYTGRGAARHRRRMGIGPIPSRPAPADDPLAGRVTLSGEERDVDAAATPSSPGPPTPRASSERARPPRP